MYISPRCSTVCFWAGKDENHGCPQCSAVSSIPSRTWVDIFYWFVLSTWQWHGTQHGLGNCVSLQQHDRQWRSFSGSGHASPTPSSLLVAVSILVRQLGQRSWCKCEWVPFLLRLFFPSDFYVSQKISWTSSLLIFKYAFFTPYWSWFPDSQEFTVI